MRRSLTVLAGCVGLSAAAPAWAEPPPAPAEHRVDFRADQVELETDARSLDLQGNVVIRSERFRLTGERLSLARSPRGVHVEGAGVLALCPCEKPPIAFGLRSADLAPPSDVLMKSATLRVFGVPIFYWPYLWLRSPNRTGVLPPSVAYRGEEGLLLGSGLHVPLKSAPNASIDLNAAGYVRGGARLEAQLRKPGARVDVAFDQFRGSALDLRSTASSAGENGSFAALRADWLAGARGQSGTSALERVVLPSDRFHAAIGRAGSGVLAFSLRADAPRSALLGELGWAGPGLGVGMGGALGRRARYAVFAETQSLQSSREGALIARAGGELSASFAFGPMVTSASSRERLSYVSGSERVSRELVHETRLRFALPLARRYGALIHGVAPFAEASLMAGSRALRADDPMSTVLTAPMQGYRLVTGVSSSLGAPLDRAGSAELLGGLSGDGARSEPVLAGRLRADAAWVRASAEARALPEHSSADALLRLELGAEDSLRVGGHVEGARGDVTAASGVFSDDFSLPANARFDRSGFSGGARVHVPFGPRISTSGGAEFDVSRSEVLAWWGQLRYRHPCRCMSLSVLGAHRTGRSGVDVGVNLELIPQ
ncbi:MAG TPA: hypothetical protein VFQ35_22660 [Polyangiaceae bacterium]|nr:hypothetical protein [Polyangiaceae bacterium]